MSNFFKFGYFSQEQADTQNLFSLSGDLYGPSSAIDNSITRFNGTTGKLVQSSGVILDDNDDLTGIDNLTTTTGVVAPTITTDSITSTDSNIALNSKNLTGVGNVSTTSLRTNQIQPASGDNVSLFFNNLTDVITISGTTANMTTVETNNLDTKTGSNIACNSRNLINIGNVNANGFVSCQGDIFGGGDLTLTTSTADTGPKIYLNNNHHADGSTNEQNEIVSQFYRNNTSALFDGGRIVFDKRDDYDSLAFCTAWIDFYSVLDGTEKRALSLRNDEVVVFSDLNVYTSDTQNLIIKPVGSSSIIIDHTGLLYFDGSSSIWRINGSESQQIQLSGESTNSMKFACTGNMHLQAGSGNTLISTSVYANTSGSSANMFIASDGAMFRSTSSKKYKRDIEDYDKGLDTVMKLKPKYYKAKNSPAGVDPERRYAGLIAEDLYDLGLVEYLEFTGSTASSEPSKENVESIGYDRLCALLINSVKEQQKKIDSLQSQMDDILKRID